MPKKAKPKFYVVWRGKETGIFKTWADCKDRTQGFPGAQFKSFSSLHAAEEAFATPYISGSYDRASLVIELTEEKRKLVGEPIIPSISVDGAWNTETGKVEYKGVYTDSKKEVFRSKVYDNGTNNIVEFLGIVHALALCKKEGWNLPIYSDSRIAIKWVKIKQAKTKQLEDDSNRELFSVLRRAEKWLNENTYENQVLKWETRFWGENPADFGRK